MTKSLCLIPAKGCSTRLPRKNMLPLNGRPMVVNTIRKVLASAIFNEICVSTEDDEIASVSRKNHASVPFIRPASLSRDPSTVIDVILHALEYYQSTGIEFDKVCVILPTAPFISSEDIINANQLFDAHEENTLMSVTTTEFPPFNAWVIVDENDKRLLAPCFPDSPYKYTKSTECPKTYRSNGAILILNTKNILEKRTYRSQPIIPYIMPIERSLDIDTQFEYEFAKYLTETENLGLP